MSSSSSPPRHGGRLLGRGSKGAVYEMNCRRADEDTLCARLQENLPRIRELTLYPLTGRSTRLTSADDIGAFVRKLTAAVDPPMAAKYFVRSLMGYAQTDFENELGSIRLLNRVFGPTKLLQRTAAGILDGFIGFSVRMEFLAGLDERTEFYVFNARCGRSVESTMNDGGRGGMTRKQIEQMVSDLLPVLDVLSRKRFVHMDIKPGNIVSCPAGNGFKLIDWENAQSFAALRRKPNWSSLESYSPILHYLSWGYAFDSITFATRIKEAYLFATHKHSLSDFNAIVDRLNQRVQEIIDTHHGDKDALFRQYCRTFDLFNFGITLIKVLLHGQHRRYLEFAERCIMLGDRPFASPGAALRAWNQLVRNTAAAAAPRTRRKRNRP